MEIEKKTQIANSFSKKFDEVEMDISLTNQQVELLEKGFFSGSMDEKWDIFVLNNFLYFSRSWSDLCFYKASIKNNKNGALINNLKVARIKNRFKRRLKKRNLEYETNLFKTLLQNYLRRDDIYVDERINLPKIKSIINDVSKENEIEKSIGSQSVKLNLSVYNSLHELHSKDIKVIGLEELTKNSMKFKPNYELLSLHVWNKNNPKNATTYFFNNEGTELIGQITIVKIKNDKIQQIHLAKRT